MGWMPRAISWAGQPINVQFVHSGRTPAGGVLGPRTRMASKGDAAEPAQPGPPKYKRVERKATEPGDIAANEIRIKANQSRRRTYILYALKLLQREEDPVDSIVLKAMGRAINKGILIAEVVKRRVAGLHQLIELESNEIVDTWEPVEEGLDTITTTRKVSCMTITLSKKQLDASKPGYQAPLPADQVKPEESIDDANTGVRQETETVEQRVPQRAEGPTPDEAGVGDRGAVAIEEVGGVAVLMAARVKAATKAGSPMQRRTVDVAALPRKQVEREEVAMRGRSSRTSRRTRWSRRWKHGHCGGRLHKWWREHRCLTEAFRLRVLISFRTAFRVHGNVNGLRFDLWLSKNIDEGKILVTALGLEKPKTQIFQITCINAFFSGYEPAFVDFDV
eukprot:g34494.t1